MTTPDRIGRAFSAASAREAQFAVALVEDALYAASQAGSATTCPAVTVSGATSTVNGGCTDAMQQAWQGTVAVTSGATTHFVFSSFTFSDPPNAADVGAIAIDGTIDIANPFAPASLDTSLQVTFAGLEVISNLHLTSPGPTWTASAGSTIDIVGFGEGTISGTWATYTNGTPSGSLAVAAIGDTLTLDIAHPNANDCVPYTAGTTSGMACAPFDHAIETH